MKKISRSQIYFLPNVRYDNRQKNKLANVSCAQVYFVVIHFVCVTKHKQTKINLFLCMHEPVRFVYQAKYAVVHIQLNHTRLGTRLIVRMREVELGESTQTGLFPSAYYPSFAY